MKIASLIFVGFIVILLLFSITTYVNYRQSVKVQENTQWVQRSQLVIRQAARLHRNITEMESSLRGFLLTNEPSFLEPYDSAISENNQLYIELKSQIEKNSFQERRLDDIEQLQLRWDNEFAQPLITAKKNALISDSAQRAFMVLYSDKVKNRTEKSISNQIRQKFKEFNNYEYDLRDVRRATLGDSVEDTERISFLLTTLSIVIGLAIAFYISLTISRRINTMVQLADRIANGNFGIFIQDNARDELGHLAKSLNSMAKTLNENISQLERKNEELDRFAYVVSHDLKAPLRGIENISYCMEEDYGDEMPVQVKDYLSLMRGRIHRMENMIKGILELSRIGRQKNPVETVNTGLMLQEIIEMLSPQTGMQIFIQPDMPVMETEKTPLQQVFTNLISNSVKYHHQKKGKVLIACKEKEDCYEFSVTDDGPGIEPKYHEKIFIIFQTLKERDAFESTGVGLAIVKKILDDKKCTIKVLSEIGNGATFVFTWPKHVADYITS
jgi:signal transduction histidine kinase